MLAVLGALIRYCLEIIRGLLLNELLNAYSVKSERLEEMEWKIKAHSYLIARHKTQY